MNFFDKLTKKYPNLKKCWWAGGGGRGGGGGGGLVNKCFKWHFFSSKRTIVPNYSEIHA